MATITNAGPNRGPTGSVVYPDQSILDPRAATASSISLDAVYSHQLYCPSTMGSMSYRPCRNCGFWVTRRERFCVNCGAFKPHLSRGPHRAFWLIAWTVFGGLLGGSVFFGRFDQSFTAYGMIGGCLIGLGWGLGLFTEVTAIVLDRRRAPSLETSEVKLVRRLGEIDRLRRRITNLKERLLDTAPFGSRRMFLDMLETADGRIAGYRIGFRVEIAKLELIRWQNRIEPLVAEMEDAGYGEYRRRLDSLIALTDRGHEIAFRWERARLHGHPVGKEVVARMRRSLEFCEKAQTALMAGQLRHLVAELAGTRPHGEPSALIDDALTRVDAFSSRDEVLELATHLEDIQYEYDRFIAATELEQTLQQSPDSDARGTRRLAAD